MRRLFNIIREDYSYLLFGFLGLCFFSSILFLKDPLIWPDEAIYVDTAKNWLITGRLYSDLFGDAVFGLKKIAAWYPPLYFYLLAAWIKIFGSSIESVRILSFGLALGSLVAVYYIAKKLFHQRYLALLAMLLVATDYFFGRSSRIARMDILNFFFLAYAYLFYLYSQNSSSKWVWLSGVFSGLAVLSHPLGLLAVVIIALNLRVRKLAAYILPVLAAIIFWVATLQGEWEIFIKQWALQIQRKAISETFTLTLLKGGLSWWHLLFAVYMISFVFVVFRWLVYRQEKERFLAIGFFFSAIMLLNGKEMFYHLYYQPFMSLMLVNLLYRFIGLGWKKYLAWGLIGLVILINLQLFVGTNNEYGRERQDYYLLGKVMAPALSKKPATIYLSALPDPYFLLQENKRYSFREFPTMYTTNNEYYSLLDEADWVIWNTTFDLRFRKYMELNTAKTSEINLSTHYAMIVTKLVNKKNRQWPKK